MDVTEQIAKIEKRISQLNMEIGHGQYYDGWTLKGMKKEVVILKDKLTRLKERQC